MESAYLSFIKNQVKCIFIISSTRHGLKPSFSYEHLPDKDISISYSVRNEMIDIISRHYRTLFPLYTQILMGMPKIFSPDLFWHASAVSFVLKSGNRLFFPIRAWILPQKDRKTGSQKVKRDFLKKVRYCIIFQKKKQGRTIIQNARWWGGDNLSVKGLYFKNTLRLAFFRAEL